MNKTKKRILIFSSLLIVVFLIGTGIYSLVNKQDANLSARTASFTAPLTTKGDIFTYSTTDARLGVGANGKVLTASSSATTGLDWTTVTGIVTSVDMSVPTGLTIAGNPITTSGTLALSLTSGYSIPLTASSTDWNTAYLNSISLTASSTDWNTAYLNRITSATYPLSISSNAISTVATSSLSLEIGSFLSPNISQWTNNSLYISSSSLPKGNFFVGNDAGAVQATSTLFLSSTGKVGIGTTTPGFPLVIQTTDSTYSKLQSSATNKDSAWVFNDGTNEVYNGLLAGSGGGAGNWAVYNGGVVLIASSTGRIGIGGVNISGMLDITASDARNYTGLQINQEDTSSAIGLNLVMAGTGIALQVDGAGTGYSGIFNNGNVGILDASPASALTVGSGDLFQVNSSGAIVAITGISTATGVYDFGGATSLEIPNGATPLTGTTGQIAVDTTSDQFHYYGASATSTLINYQSSSFTYATSTAWTATTTIPLGVAWEAETWSGVKCFTNTGTLNVDFYDGTNRMGTFNASTTVGTIALGTNNTFTASEKRYVDVGTPASTPTKISCTIKKSVDLN